MTGNKDNERADELSTPGALRCRQKTREAFQRQWRAGKLGTCRAGREEANHPRLRSKPYGSGEESTRRKQRRNLLKYPAELRGLPNNRYGGHPTTRMRTYNAQLPWGSAGECHVYTEEEKRELGEKDAG